MNCVQGYSHTSQYTILSFTASRVPKFPYESSTVTDPLQAPEFYGSSLQNIQTPPHTSSTCPRIPAMTGPSAPLLRLLSVCLLYSTIQSWLLNCQASVRVPGLENCFRLLHFFVI